MVILVILIVVLLTGRDPASHDVIIWSKWMNFGIMDQISFSCLLSHFLLAEIEDLLSVR